MISNAKLCNLVLWCILLLQLSSSINLYCELTIDSDLSIAIGGSKFAVPGGKTEEIKLSKILKVEEGGFVQIDPDNGNYYLYKVGQGSTTNISVEDFDIPEPTIAPVYRQINFSDIQTRSGITLTGDIPSDSKSSFTMSTVLPNSIKNLSQIKAISSIKLRFSFTSATVQKLTFQTLYITIPSYTISNEVDEEGVKSIENMVLLIDNSNTVNIPIQGLHVSEDMLTQNADGTLTLQISGDVTMSGKLSVNSNDVNFGAGSLSVSLKIETFIEDIKVKSIKGIVDPNIDIEIASMDMDDIPVYLSDKEVRLDMKNPMVLLDINNQSPVGASIDGMFTSVYADDIDNVSIGFRINEILPNQLQSFCLSPQNPDKPNTQWVEVSNMPKLMRRIPLYIQRSEERRVGKEC